MKIKANLFAIALLSFVLSGCTPVSPDKQETSPVSPAKASVRGDYQGGQETGGSGGSSTSITIRASSPTNIIYVSRDNPADPPYGHGWTNNIQAAINMCPVGGLVSIAPGTYPLTSAITVSTAIAISGSGQGRTILAANGIGFSGVKIIGQGTNAVMSDLSITGFASASGAGSGVYGEGAYGRFTLRNCTISDNGDHTPLNLNGNGAGVFLSTLYNCTITRNQGGHGAGAAFCNIYDSIISDNVGQDGAGVYQCKVYNSTLTRNDAPTFAVGNGGAAFKSWLYNCTVVSNHASQDGGAAAECYAVNKCTIAYNLADYHGGGVELCPVEDSLFYSNRCPASPYSATAIGSTFLNCRVVEDTNTFNFNMTIINTYGSNTLYSRGIIPVGSNIYNLGSASLPWASVNAHIFNAIGSAYQIDGKDVLTLNADGNPTISSLVIIVNTNVAPSNTDAVTYGAMTNYVDTHSGSGGSYTPSFTNITYVIPSAIETNDMIFSTGANKNDLLMLTLYGSSTSAIYDAVFPVFLSWYSSGDFRRTNMITKVAVSIHSLKPASNITAGATAIDMGADISSYFTNDYLVILSSSNASQREFVQSHGISGSMLQLDDAMEFSFTTNDFVSRAAQLNGVILWDKTANSNLYVRLQSEIPPNTRITIDLDLAH
jgi:hypothetical protein